MLTRAQKEAAFDLYLTEILSIQSTFDELGGGTLGARMESVDQRPPRTGLASAGQPPRRGRSSVEPESDDEDVQPSKRQRLLESDMPWYTDSGAPSASSYSHPSCEETCEPTTLTSPKPSSSSRLRQTPQQESPPHSGSVSSREILSTSIISSRHSTMLSLMKREWVAWEKRKLLSELLKLRNEFPRPLNGPLPGRGP